MLVLVGIPCPACGSSRMLDAVLKGRLLEAFLLNPFFFILVLLSLVVVVTVSVIGPKGVLKKLDTWSADTWLRVAWVTVAAMLLNWIYLLNFGSW